jgi:glycine cleavage system T protein (aminomethyltransferase)
MQAGLIPPKDETPVAYDSMLYDDDGARIGYATNLMYSPVLQRHIAMARLRPDMAEVGSRVNFELTVNHQYQTVAAEVARLPLYNPKRKTA